MLSWAVYREGSAAGWMRTDLESVLLPYLEARQGRGRVAAARSDEKRRREEK
jgi:hypothetical protein